MGATVVPCIVVDDLPDAEVRRLSLSLNKLQETGEWDQEALRLEINELIEIDGEIEFPGFEMPEIEAIRFGPLGAEDPDPADEVSCVVRGEGNTVTRTGDVWKLGDHLIFCGSARDGVEISALLDGAIADVIFTDPPYNVKIAGNARSANAGFEEFAEASGEMSREDYTAFLVETLGNAAAVLKPGGVLFASMDWRHVGEMNAALETLGLDLLNICVWVKSAPGMGSLYRNHIDLLDVHRSQYLQPELISVAAKLRQQWNPNLVIVEAVGAGRGLYDHLKRQLREGLRPHRPKQGKIERMSIQSPKIENGQVRIPQSAPWKERFLEEVAQFPNGNYDDQVDSMSQALRHLDGNLHELRHCSRFKGRQGRVISG